MSEIKNHTTPITGTYLAQTNIDDFAIAGQSHKIEAKPIESGFSSKIDELRHKPEVIHDPYWSMIHRKKHTYTPRTLNTDPNLMTIMEVANLLRVAPLTLKRWEKKGHIQAIRINSRGDRRYLRSEIERLINK